jgi:hypothetical protein
MNRVLLVLCSVFSALLSSQVVQAEYVRVSWTLLVEEFTGDFEPGLLFSDLELGDILYYEYTVDNDDFFVLGPGDHHLAPRLDVRLGRPGQWVGGLYQDPIHRQEDWYDESWNTINALASTLS